MVDSDHAATSRSRPLVRALFAFIALVALALRLWAPGPTAETYDENLWLHRSDAFAAAISHAHFSQASAGDPALGLTNPTMPGVTTMWAGIAGRQIAKASGALGLSAPIRGPSAESAQVLRAAQSTVSIVCVALLLLLMVMLRRLFGARVALFTGALLAVEPWAVGLGHMLHTDAMVTMFSVASLTTLAWALRSERLPTSGPTGPPRTGWLVVAAALAAGGLLTKTNAIGILGPGMALISWEAWRHRYRDQPRLLIRAAVIGLMVVGVISILAWPALLTSPVQQVQLMFDASKQVGKTRLRFFHGSLQGFVPEFYVVALAFRLTPWMLAWCAVGVGGGVADLVRRLRRDTRRGFDEFGPMIPSWVLLTPLPYFVVISLSRFGYDRYALAVIPYAVIGGACVATRWSRRLPGIRALSPRMLAACGGLLVLAAAVVPIRHAPYGTQYVNGLWGGETAAVRWIPVESGQVSGRLSADLAAQVHGRCARTRVAVAYPHPASDYCGRSFAPQTVEELRTADYAFTFAVGDQTSAREWFTPWLRRHATLVDTVDVGGVVFGRLWRLPDQGT